MNSWKLYKKKCLYMCACVLKGGGLWLLINDQGLIKVKGSLPKVAALGPKGGGSTPPAPALLPVASSWTCSCWRPSVPQSVDAGPLHVRRRCQLLSCSQIPMCSLLLLSPGLGL